MKKNLIIVNTYFQLITIINLIKTELKYDINDIILTDRSVEMNNKVSKLQKSKLFNKIIYIESKKFSSKYKKLKTIICLINRNILLNNQLNENYDNLYFFNYDYLTTTVFDQLVKKNSKLKLNIYDEGYITYLRNRKINKYVKLLRKIFFKKDFDKKIDLLYLYHPELVCFKSDNELKKINPLNNIEIRNDINMIFNYNEYNIKQKYIFFEESFFCDNKGIDDLNLILKIAKIVGKENLIVKLHPRNPVNRFEEYGINTLPFTDIPWEVIQMNNDFSDKILMTISSGSVLASKLYFNENIKTFLLFNCTDKMSDMVNDKYLEYLEKVKENMGMENFYIPNNEKEFLEELKKTDNKNNFNEEI